MKLSEDKITELFEILKEIKGGYVYYASASTQYCFPLKNGGELRFSRNDEEPENTLSIDLYGGGIPPCITGFAEKTG